MNRRHRTRVREALKKQQGTNCCYCRMPMWQAGQESTSDASFRLSVPKKELYLRRMTIEHLHEQKDGGGHQIGNLALACFGCNQERNRMQMNWLEFATFKSNRKAA